MNDIANIIAEQLVFLQDQPVATFVIVWLVGALIASLIAIYKHRSGLGFMLLSLLFSPIIGILGALLAMPNQISIENSRLRKNKKKQLPL